MGRRFGHPQAPDSGPSILRGFDIHIVNRPAGTLCLEVHGELDVATAPLLDAKLAEAEATDARIVLLDLADMPFIDSSGLGALLRAHVRSAENGDRMRITGASEQALKLFELAGVLEKLPFLPAAE